MRLMSAALLCGILLSGGANAGEVCRGEPKNAAEYFTLCMVQSDGTIAPSSANLGEVRTRIGTTDYAVDDEEGGAKVLITLVPSHEHAKANQAAVTAWLQSREGESHLAAR